MPTAPPEFDPREFLRSASQRPGVYRMLDADGEVLYVGKAKSLKKRLASYFRGSGLESKTRALVDRIAGIEVTVTNSETEALLLEQTLIKSLRPPYNILLRDDKSYPYLYLSEHGYPMLAFRRGRKSKKGRYFGPYPSSYAVRESLTVLQKVFRLRSCEDSFFRNRSRPCLQYQIKRCSGPCVGLVDPDDYAEDVRHAVMFLEGRSQQVVEELQKQMDSASEALEFEKAAVYRDQIAQLVRVQQQQVVMQQDGDVDVIASAAQPGGVCIQVVVIRGGRVLGNKNFYPTLRFDRSEGELLSEFIPQFYLGSGKGRDVPPEILVSAAVEDRDCLEDALVERAGRKVRILSSVRGKRAKWLKLARTNAAQSLVTLLASRENMAQRLDALAGELGLGSPPQRLECFDISHTMGEAPQASCVVFETGGPLKSDYRRFNIEDVTPGDDYAAIAQAVRRRYTRLKAGEARIPDLLFIDGGKGQVSATLEVLEELQVPGLMVVGVAKGSGRRPGLERLFVAEKGSNIKEVSLRPDSAGLHLIQHLRDEAHRFAISGHRNRRGKKRSRSPLEDIPGVGPKRRRDLLRYFGGLQEIERATVDDLVRVPGISRALANDIYVRLHGEEPA